MANAVTFWKGTKAKYDALTEKPNTRIFFCEDTGEIFKGTVRFSDGQAMSAKELLTDYDPTEGVNEKISKQYLPKIQFQGQDIKAGDKVIDGIGPTINFIGIGDVSTDEAGNITIRLGENLNCSNWNKTDGISNGAVKSLSGNFTTGIPSSAAFSDVSSCTSKKIAYQGNTNKSYIIAKTGTSTATDITNIGTATTTAGASKNNGNEVHFTNNTSCYFRVNIVEGKNTSSTSYYLGPITAGSDSGTSYTAKTAYDGAATVTGIKCTVKNFGEEPKKADGASGYSGLVGINISPSTLYAGVNKDFKVKNIDLVSIEGGVETNVSTWDCSSTYGECFHLSTSVTVDGAAVNVSSLTGSVFNSDTYPAGYTLTKGTTTKTIHGVTYYTSASFTATCGAKNIGFPACVNNKVNISPKGGTWFNTTNVTSTDNFKNQDGTTKTWVDAKDGEMKFISSPISLNMGDWANSSIDLKGINIIGTQSTALNIPVAEKILICNGTTYLLTSQTAGTYFPAPTNAPTLPDGELMWFDGALVYPSRDFSVYEGNETYTVPAATERSYTKTFTFSGNKTNATINLTHTRSIETALANGEFRLEIKSGQDDFIDVIKSDRVKITSQSYTSSSTTVAFDFNFGDDYPDGGSAIRITMGSAVTEVKNIELA